MCAKCISIKRAKIEVHLFARTLLILLLSKVWEGPHTVSCLLLLHTVFYLVSFLAFCNAYQVKIVHTITEWGKRDTEQKLEGEGERETCVKKIIQKTDKICLFLCYFLKSLLAACCSLLGLQQKMHTTKKGLVFIHHSSMEPLLLLSF